VIVGVDRLGRRRALLIGSAGAAFALYYIAIYSAVSKSFEAAPPRDGGAYFALVSIYLFSVFYAFSWNGIPWIFCAEVFPSGIRAVCTVITTMNQWLAQFVIAYSFPYMVECRLSSHGSASRPAAIILTCLLSLRFGNLHFLTCLPACALDE
jgi:hypothetical protein